MKFGLNKVTGIDRQTIEQLKDKVIDGGGGGGGGGTWQEVLVTDITLHTDDVGVIWYQIPQDADNILIEFTDGNDQTAFFAQEAEIPNSAYNSFGVNGDPDTYWLYGGTCEVSKKVAFYDMQMTTQFLDVDGGYSGAQFIGYSFSSKAIWVCYFAFGDEEKTNNNHIKFYKKV